MTREEAIGFLQSRVDLIDKDYPDVKDYREALVVAIKALEQNPCEDCISRTELLSKIDAERKYLLNLKMDGAEHIIVHHARRIIEDMPSITPQPKTGQWINIWDKNDYDISTQARCNKCKQVSNRPLGNFCKWCGAKMEVAE